jgi:hypothetical protein
VLDQMATRLRGLLPGSSTDEDALGVLATMVGGMVLARAVDDPAQSERLLRAAKRFAGRAAHP